MNKLQALIGVLLITACVGFPQQTDDEYYDASEVENEEDVADEPQVPNPTFTDKSRTIAVQENEDVEMPCLTTEPTQHVLIFKKMAEDPNKEQQLIYVGIMKVSTRFVNEDNVFKLSKVSRKEAGTYACYFQPHSENKLTYVLDVQYPPSVIAKSLKEQRVEKGESVTVECQAGGNPKPVITWSKESGRLPSGSDKEEGFSMTLENVDRHVEGVYICTADNGIGTPVSAPMKILVEYPPEITTEKAIIRTGKGDKVEIVCIVHARPVASVTWSKDGNPFSFSEDINKTDVGHRHALTISNVAEDYFGTYMCDAMNEKGNSKAEINLTDLPKQPHFTSPSTSAEETSYTLAWETESYYPIEQYIIKYRQTKANESTNVPGEWIERTVEMGEDEGDMMSEGLMYHMKSTIQDLLPATDYEATVSVKNQFKWGEKGEFNFSTRKASPTTTTIATSTTTTPLPLTQENVQHPTEIVSSQTTSAAGITTVNVMIGTLALILSQVSKWVNYVCNVSGEISTTKGLEKYQNHH